MESLERVPPLRLSSYVQRRGIGDTYNRKSHDFNVIPSILIQPVNQEQERDSLPRQRHDDNLIHPCVAERPHLHAGEDGVHFGEVELQHGAPEAAGSVLGKVATRERNAAASERALARRVLALVWARAVWRRASWRAARCRRSFSRGRR